MEENSRQLPAKPLNEEQKLYIMKRLAKNWEYEEIKENFQWYFEQGISGEEIIKIEIKYQKEIEKIAPQVLDPKKHRLAHAANRLEELQEALLDAKTLRPVGPPVKTGPDTWEAGPSGMNIGGIVAINKAAREEEYMAKKFYIELVKAKLEKEKEELLGSGFLAVQINTAMDEELKELPDASNS